MARKQVVVCDGCQRSPGHRPAPAGMAQTQEVLVTYPRRRVCAEDDDFSQVRLDLCAWCLAATARLVANRAFEVAHERLVELAKNQVVRG